MLLYIFCHFYKLAIYEQIVTHKDGKLKYPVHFFTDYCWIHKRKYITRTKKIKKKEYFIWKDIFTQEKEHTIPSSLPPNL